jgi:hypothetical protein
MLNYSILLKKISKLENINVIQDVINSVNDNQIKNKLWLIDKLKPYLDIYTNPKISIAAGWHGLLAHLLDDKDNITSFDIDNTCKKTKLFDNVSYKTNDIVKQDPKESDILICTSCEHIIDDNVMTWIKRKKENSIVVLQSNDYFQIEDHINCKKSLPDFKKSILKKAKNKKIDLRVINSYELEMPKYTRFMLFLS